MKKGEKHELFFLVCPAGPDELPAECQDLANPASSKGRFGVESKPLDGVEGPGPI